MKKKIIIGSIFTILLMLSMPMITNIQAEENNCSICPYKIKSPSGRPICDWVWDYQDVMDENWDKWVETGEISYLIVHFIQFFFTMSLWLFLGCTFYSP